MSGGENHPVVFFFSIPPPPTNIYNYTKKKKKIQLVHSSSPLSFLLALSHADPLPEPEVPPLPDASAPVAPWPACQKNLSCDLSAIQSAPLNERLAYVRDMQSQFFSPHAVAQRRGCHSAVHR